MRPFLLCIMFWCGSAAALSLTPGATRVESMLREADAVIYAEVTDRAVARNPDDDIPHTFYRMKVEKVITGSVESSELIMRIWGAETDEESVGFVGTPQFSVGDRIIVFVRGNGEEAVPIVNFHWGVFWVDRAPDNTRFVTDAEGYPVKALNTGPVEVDRRSEKAICLRDAIVPEAQKEAERRVGKRPELPLACPGLQEQLAGTLRPEAFIAAIEREGRRHVPSNLRPVKSTPWVMFDAASRQSLRRYTEIKGEH